MLDLPQSIAKLFPDSPYHPNFLPSKLILTPFQMLHLEGSFL